MKGNDYESINIRNDLHSGSLCGTLVLRAATNIFKFGNVTKKMMMQEQVELSQETINKIFDEAKHQGGYVIALYRVAFPEWDEIATVNGYPSVGQKTNEYIFEKAIAFDKLKHPDVMYGGHWMNRGFRTDETLAEWLVIPCSFVLIESRHTKPLTRLLKDDVWKAVKAYTDLLLDGEEMETMSVEEVQVLKVVQGHLWRAHRKLKDIDTRCAS